MHTNTLRQTEAAAPNRNGRRQRGFTLIEMLIVLGIIAFIATLVGSGMLEAKRKAERRQATAGVHLVASAVERYELDCGLLPDKLEDLRRAPNGQANWNGPYLKASQTKDPWGTPYILDMPGSDGQLYSVRSLGADRVAGGTGHGADLDSND